MQGLRPHGEYEFRVLARNAEGYSEPSRTSGPVAVIPRSADAATMLNAHNEYGKRLKQFYQHIVE